MFQIVVYVLNKIIYKYTHIKFSLKIYKGGVNLRERDHWGDQDVDGRIILRWIFRKWGLDGVGSG